MSRRRRRIGFRLKKQVAQGNSDEMNKSNNSAKINSSDNLEPNQANQVQTGAHGKREHGNQQRENDARTSSASQSAREVKGASSPDSASSVAAGSVASESSGVADIDVELSAPRVVAQETPLVSHLHADEAAQEESAPEESAESEVEGSAESEAGESEAEAARVSADEEHAELQEHNTSEESLASDDAADHDDVDEDAPSQHSEVSAQPDDDNSGKPAAEAQDDTEPEAEVEAESEPRADQEPETEALAEIKPAPEVAASLKSKAEAEKETEPEAKSESEPEPEPESEPVPSADETQSSSEQPTSQPSTAEKVTQEVKVATSNALNQAKKSIVEENSKPKPRRVKAFDGLRGLAILAIIAFHTTPSLMPGGFLAVTVFFVLSGYLITHSLLGRMDRHRFNLLGYWGERILRIWPATLAAIAFAAGVAWVWLPSALTKIRSDAVPTALFATNWVQIFRQVPYFDQAGLPSPLTPFWFVALIVQFYLLWSVMLWLLHKLTHGNRGAMGWITLLLMLISTGLSCWLLNPMDVTRVYYGLDTRWAELMAGALIAFLTIRGSESVHKTAQNAGKSAGKSADSPLTTSSTAPGILTLDFAAFVPQKFKANAHLGFEPKYRDAFVWVAMLIIAVASSLLNSQSTWIYRGGLLAVALLVALSVAMLAVSDGMTAAETVLSSKLLVWLGSRSFSLYLVHYVMIEAFFPATRTTPMNWWEWFVDALIIAVVAELFHQIAEKGSHPGFLHSGLRFTNALAWLVGAAMVVALALPMPWASWIRSRQIAVRPELAASLSAPEITSTDNLAPNNGGSAASSHATTSGEKAGNTENSSNTSGEKSGKTGGENSSKAGAQKGDKKSSKKGGVALVKHDVPLPDKPKPIAASLPGNLAYRQWNRDKGTCSANPIIIGDSILEGTKSAVEKALPNAIVDSKVSRQLGTAADILNSYNNPGDDQRPVVIALGTNGPMGSTQIWQPVLQALHGRSLYVVSERVPRYWQDANNQVLRDLVKQNPGTVGLIDWQAYSQGHSEWFWDDGTHVNPATGAPEYAKMMSNAFCAPE